MKELEFTTEECARFVEQGIIALVLFGSRAQGIAREDSDYDIGVLMRSDNDDVRNRTTHTAVYDMVYEAVSEHLQRVTDVDIVFLADAPGELKAHVMKYGVVVFESHPTVFADFKECTMREYADFAPHRALFQHATLARIA